MKDNTVKNIIIVVLTLALVGFIGYFIWSSSSPNKETDSNGDVSITSPKNTLNKKEDDTDDVDVKQTACLENEKICFEYSSDWKNEVKDTVYPAKDSEAAKGLSEDEFDHVDSGYLVHKNDDLKIKVESGVTQLGGGCVPGSRGEVNVIESSEVAVGGQDNVNDEAPRGDTDPLHAVKYIKSLNGKYTSRMHLTKIKEMTVIGKTDACNSLFSMYFPGKNARPNYRGGPDSHGAVNFYLESKEFNSMDEAKDFLNKKSVEEAFEIMQSVYYK